MIARIYANRNHAPAAITCKLGTILATSIWSLLVICKPDALALTPYDRVVFGYPRIAGTVLLVISALQVYWLWAHCNPFRFCFLGYGVQFGLWIGMLILLLFDSPRDPAAVAGAGTVVCLAWWAFVSGALRKRRDAVVG